MNVISRIQFPRVAETANLYIRASEGISIEFDASDSKVLLREGSCASLNTYFNSIYEKFYRKYTALRSLFYELELEGDFEVSAYRETDDNAKQLIHRQFLQNCQRTNPVKVSLPPLESGQASGRIYLELTCLSQQGVFTAGAVVTGQASLRTVSLAIITCTFKKEAYVKNTVNAILRDRLLQAKPFNLFVVDNGKTLSQNDMAHDKVTLITNRNVGGSGGFTRGLIEALQAGGYTHFLFMDDDIELDSEVIYRLFALYEYAEQDFAVAGSMLDLYKKHLLFEAGSMYNRCFDDRGNLHYRPFTLTLLKHDLDLRDPASLNSLLVEDDIDYGGFWFFCFSLEVVREIGLPLPFFIKIDDMEYGLRIKKHLENGIVAFPSIAVWHEPFYAKKPVWDFYYCTRNELIADSIHGSLGYFNTVQVLTKCIIYHLLLFDYNSALMFIKAFNDYMQGPEFIKSHDPEVLHSSVYASSRSHKSQAIVPDLALSSENYQATKTGAFQKLASLLTLNGHLLPEALIRDQTVTILHASDQRDSVCKGLAKRQVTFFMEKNPYAYHNRLDRRAAVEILVAWSKAVINGSWSWATITAAWKESFAEFTSLSFWQRYLEPDQ